jgi:hypothetical protein
MVTAQAIIADVVSPREHRAGDEDRDRRDEDRLAPVEVAELAVERRRDGRGEQVGRDDPRQVVEAAEVAGDGRERGRTIVWSSAASTIPSIRAPKMRLIWRGV